MAYYPPRATMVKRQSRPISKKRSRKMALTPYKGKKYSNRNQQLFMGQKKAARYGFFMDMLKKYAAVKTIGATGNVAQRMVSRITRNRFSRQSSTKMKIKGFRVARFVLQSIPCNFLGEVYNMAGYIPKLQVRFKPMINDTQLYQNATNFHTTVLNPFVTLDQDVWAFHPTWPGSKMAAWLNYPLGPAPSKQPEWGLITGNSATKNDNMQYNSRAVKNVKGFATYDELTVDRLDILFRKINVYKTSIKMEFWNNDRGVEMDVHIVHFRLTDRDYSGAVDTCNPANNYDQLVNNIATCSGGSIYKKNNWMTNWQNCVDMKKLPPQNFITKSWRTITLGRCYDGLKLGTDTSIDVNGSVTNGRSPYRSITLKYGPKVWYREGCIEEGTLFEDDTIQDTERTDTHVMFFTSVNKKYWTTTSRDRITTTPVPTTETGEVTYGVNFKLTKTHLWREDN